MATKRKARSTIPSNSRQDQVVEELEQENLDEENESESGDEESASDEEGDDQDEGGESEEDGEEEEEDEDEDEEKEEESSEEESGDENSKRETLRELLEPFGKSQIIDILKRAAAEDQTLLPDIIRMADIDPVHRKIFVFGLGWDTTYDQLLQTFKPFGEIEECKLITDKNTGRSKGYAFVVFKTRASAKKALKVPQKQIGNRTTSCQLAAIGLVSGSVAADGNARKIYMGNVGPLVNPEKLYSFFAKFGEIEEGPLGIDPVTNKFKGFAVFTYKSAEGYKKAMEEPIKVFENCQLHCKKFIENQNKNNPSAKTSGSNTNSAVTDPSYGNVALNAVDSRGLLMQQNQGIGMMGNPLFAGAYNPIGLVASGLSAPVARASSDYGINSYTPTVIGNYGSQATLQGLGVLQNAQLGQSSIATAAMAVTPTRAPTTGASATSIYPSSYLNYKGR